MKLNIKLFVVAAFAFAAGFGACLLLGIATSREQTSSPTVPAGLAVAFTQAQPEMIVLPPSRRSPLERRAQQATGFVPETELRQSRSLDLIDTRDRYQPKMDLKETHK